METAPEPLAGFDAVIVRTIPAGSLEQVVFRMDVLHAAAARGVRVVNPPRAVETCVDKYLTNVRLAAAGLPTPPTHVAQRADDAFEAFARLGGDVVVKPVFGAEGRGMQRVTDRELAWRTFRVLEQTGQVIYQQQFIDHPGHDLRVFVMGGKVRAAMRRSSGTDWRTNVAQGGTTERAELSAARGGTGRARRGGGGVPDRGRGSVAGPARRAVRDRGERRARLEGARARRAASTWPRRSCGSWRGRGDEMGDRGQYEIATAIRTACIWEATARKVGNVHPDADFAETTYLDFVLSAGEIADRIAEVFT